MSHYIRQLAAVYQAELECLRALGLSAVGVIGTGGDCTALGATVAKDRYLVATNTPDGSLARGRAWPGGRPRAWYIGIYVDSRLVAQGSAIEFESAARRALGGG